MRFPKFTLRPEGVTNKLFARVVGIEDINFPEHPQFSRQYQLTAVHADNTRRLFEERLAEHLGYRPGLYIVSAGSSLLIYRPETELPAEQIEAFIADASEIFHLFEASARKLQQVSEAGLIPKADAHAEAAKLGGLIGKVVRETLVTRADVEAFVRQSPPRKVPANIRHYCENFAPLLAIAVGAAFLLAGALFAVVFGKGGQWDGALIGLLLVVVGGALAFFLGRVRLRLERLLHHGELAVGRIESVEPTNWPSGLRVTVRFNGGAGITQGGCDVVGAAMERVRNLINAEKPAAVLYDPTNPQRLLLADALLTVSPEYDE